MSTEGRSQKSEDSSRGDAEARSFDFKCRECGEGFKQVFDPKADKDHADAVRKTRVAANANKEGPVCELCRAAIELARIIFVRKASAQEAYHRMSAELDRLGYFDRSRLG